MNDIRNLLKLAARRIELSTYLQCAHIVAVVAAIVALLLMAFDRAFAQSFMPWVWVAPAMVILTGGVAAILWARKRASEAQVALAVDERLDLREKLTTALHCQGRDDPFAQAAMEDGVKAARDARSREQVRRQFKVAPPGGWWFTPLIVLVTIMVSLLSPLDVFSREQPSNETIEQARLDVQQTVEVLVQDLKKSSELKTELSDILDDLEGVGSQPDPKMSPEDLKREAIKKVTDLNRKLEDILRGEKAKTNAAVQDALNELKPPTEGPAKDLAEAMTKGDFDSAKKALEEMLKQLEEGKLNDEQKQQLAQQMQNLAQQLQQMAQQQQQLKDALQQAGLDPNLANNPQALQQELQNNQNLNDEQKQQLQQMAQAQQQAQQACQNMGQACQQMAQGLQGMLGQMGQNGQQMADQFGQGGQQLMDQLNQMEGMQQMLQEAQAAMNMCQGQCQGLGQGLALQQAMMQGGMGQRGQGAGGKAPIAKTPFGAKMVKAPVKTTDGEIVMKMLVDGPQRVGESTQKITQVTLHEISDAYDQAIVDDELPRKYDEAMLHYFGELEKRVQAQTVSDAGAAPVSGESPEGDSSGQD